MNLKRVDILTLGCSKNLVDSERLARQLEEAGFHVHFDSAHPGREVVVVNTCSFIGDAKEESVDTILAFAREREEGRLERLYVMGCLPERFRKELGEEIPQVDAFFGKFDWTGLLKELGQTYRPELAWERKLSTPKHYAYLKIAEGCDRGCAYCAIPIATGRHRSRPAEEILEEVGRLARWGVKELQVMAQELTYYGMDLYGERMLPQLIDRMADVPGVEWIRLHYAYPSDFPFDLLRVMRERENVCDYLDIALQHISDGILARMRRGITGEETYALIERLRREVPGIHLRTTLMVGFPGETEADFEALKRFVKEVRFERMGAFAYSEEEGTYAARHYKDDVPWEVKTARLEELMSIQEEIAAQVAASKRGQELRVIVDRVEGDYYVGRTEFDSPEVDPEVLIPRNAMHLLQGRFYKVKITGSEGLDLYGESLGGWKKR
ncbi:MAG: 30S ribosomal protein S12 methylthiotransferase RimO [Prevotellaceae bacterium]|nr:30S ribosomal protein S12 methylthiotransferase RimO [Prevotellaceae bacterium]